MIYTFTLSPALDKTIYLETLDIGKINYVSETYIDAGGKGINVAKVLNKLGTDVTSISVLGGKVGAEIEKVLETLKINQKNIYVEEETRTNIKLINKIDNRCTELNENTKYTKTFDINNFEKIFNDVLKDGKYIVFSGKIHNGIKSDFYEEYINKANKKGIKVLLDTFGEDFKLGIKAKPWCIKPNIDEFCDYFGIDSTSLNMDKIVEKCKILNKKGIEVVIVTMDKDGLICTFDNKTYKVTVPKIKVINTVGAGDSFNGGFLHSINKGESIEDSLKYGAVISLLKVSSKGTGVDDIDNIERYLEEVKVDVLGDVHGI